MNKLVVEIISEPKESAWYKDMVGVVFTVYENSRDYVLADDFDEGSTMWRHLEKEDCEIIDIIEPKPTTP